MSNETMPQVKPIVNATNSLENLSLADTAQELCETWGFSVFPLGHKEKRPLKIGENERLEWGPYQKIAPTAEMVESWWEHHPGSNIGVICGKVSNLVVVDADNPAAVEWVLKNFIKTTVAVSTSRGFHYYYKYPHGNDSWLKAERERHKKLKDGVDIQIDGFYAVGPNSIHPNGTQYTLFEQIPGAWVDDLVPELQFATDIQEVAGTDVNIDLSDVPDYFSELKQGSRHDAILSYVGALIAKGLPYHEVLQKAREVASDRCEQTFKDPFLDKEIVSIVRSTFKSHERNHPETATTTNGGQDIATDMSGVRLVEVKDDLCDEWPRDILYPGGLLEKIADYTEKSSARTERIFAIGGAISLIGAVGSLRVQNTSELTTNLYILLVGRSSSGKDAPRKAIKRILNKSKSGLRNLFGGSDISSDAALLRYLQRDGCHRALLVFDEIGMFFKNSKNPNSPKYNLNKVLTELYYVGTDGYIKHYSDKDYDIVIPWMSLSLLGLSVGSELWPSLNSGETTNGFLSRCIVIESFSKMNETRDEDEVKTTVPKDLLAGLEKIWNIDTGENKPCANADGEGIDLAGIPTPRTIPFNAEAKQFCKEQKKAIEKLQLEADEAGDDATASIYGRCNEHAIKLAMIKYLSDHALKDGDICGGEVLLDQAQWAWLFVREATKRTLDSMKNSIHTSLFESYQQRLFKIIKKQAAKNRKKGLDKSGASLSEICRAMGDIDRQQIQKVLDKGIAGNLIRLIKRPPTARGGRPCEFYVLVEEIPEEIPSDA